MLLHSRLCDTLCSYRKQLDSGGSAVETAVEKKESIAKEISWLLLSVLAAVLIAALVVAFVVYRGMYMYVKAELGETPPDASAFFRSEVAAEYISDNDGITDKTGIRSTRIISGQKQRTVFFIVKDTVAPTAEAAEIIITADETIEPIDTLKNIRDASKVSVKWITKPEFGKIGIQKAAVELKDKSGNKSTLSVDIVVIGVVRSFELPLNSKLPDVEELVIVKHETAEYVTDISTVDMSKLSEYAIEVSVDGFVCETLLRVIDVTPPDITSCSHAVAVGVVPSPEDFVINCRDDSFVSYSFQNEPDCTTVGTLICSVSAVDEYGNETVFEAELYVCDNVINVEASNTPITDAKLFGAVYKGYKIDGGSFTPDTIGGKVLTLKKGSKTVSIGVVVRDTTAPQVQGHDVAAYTGYPHELSEFYSDVADFSEVSIVCTKEPDWNVSGEQAVEFEFTDFSGNVTVITQTAAVSPDTEGPVICGERYRYCYIGDAVAYYKEVCAYDNADPEPTLTVDKSKVNPHEVGEYTVTYTATDRDGNVSTADVKFIFREKTVSDGELDALAEKVLSEIITDDMSVAEKVFAIHDYAYSHIIYIGYSDKTDWKAEAYKGITEGIGDCFTFYATTYLLLNRIDGIEVMSVERLNGATRHYWCLVNIGTGWYHLDSCNVGPDHIRACMMTNDELDAISTYYWRYDRTLYPAGATEKFVLN